MRHASERLVLEIWAIIALIKDEQPAATIQPAIFFSPNVCNFVDKHRLYK
jgi:hypothetical protein